MALSPHSGAAPTSNQPHPSTVPVPSLSLSPLSSGASPRSPVVASLSSRLPHPLLSVPPAQRPNSCRVPPLWQPTVGFVHSQLGIFGAWFQQSQFTPAAQKSEEQTRWSHCHSSGDTPAGAVGSLHLRSHPACPQCCPCPPWGQRASCHATSCPSRHTGTQLSPTSLLAGDAAHRAAGARVLRFALGHAVRMLPEPAASSRDERSQPVPSCRTRPACPAAGSLPSCRVPAQLPGPCSASGRRRGGKSGRTILALGRLRSPASALSRVCALRSLALFG